MNKKEQLEFSLKKKKLEIKQIEAQIKRDWVWFLIICTTGTVLLIATLVWQKVGVFQYVGR